MAANGKIMKLLRYALGGFYIVAGVNQYITSKMGGFSKDQSMMITIDTFPMKWRVKRLDSDFIILRDFLLRSYPSGPAIADGIPTHQVFPLGPRLPEHRVCGEHLCGRSKLLRCALDGRG